MLKDKIILALKQRYKNVGLSEKTIETIAEMIGSNTTDEANIETAVAGVENLVKAFQSQEDARVQTAVATAKAEKSQPKQEPKKETEKVDGAANDMPEWAKALLTANETISRELQGLKAEKTIDNRKAQLEAKTKDMPETFRNPILKNFARMNFENDDSFSEFLNETETDFKAFEADLVQKGISKFPKPGVGTGPQPKADKEQVAALAEELLNI